MSEMSTTEFAPGIISPPGDTLAEILEERGMSQAELAERTGRPKKTINEIVKGRVEITPETALQFEYVLGIPAYFWNNRERRYREALARQKDNDRLSKELSVLKKIPFKAMVSLGWLPRCADPLEQMRAVYGFFGVASASALEEWAAVVEPAFRQSKAYPINRFAVLAWLRKGKIEAHRRDCATYNLQVFRQNLHIIRDLTREPTEIFEPRMKRLCGDAGVVVVFVPELPGTRVWGATHWANGDRAIIQLSLRYRMDDHLWFTFFHEAGHIVLHGKRDLFVEMGRSKDVREEEANRFAADFLIPPAKMPRIQRIRCNRTVVKALAAEIGVSPGILVGRLQHDRIIPPSHLNDLKRRLDFRPVGSES